MYIICLGKLTIICCLHTAEKKLYFLDHNAPHIYVIENPQQAVT